MAIRFKPTLTASFSVLEVEVEPAGQAIGIGLHVRGGSNSSLAQLQAHKYLSDRVKVVSGVSERINWEDPLVRAAIEPFVAKCRSKRDDIFVGDPKRGFLSVGEVNRRLGCCRNELTFSYDTEKYPIREEFAQLLLGDRGYDLSGLRLCRTQDAGNPSAAGNSKKHKKEKLLIMSPLLISSRRKKFHELYDDFVRSVIIPRLDSELEFDVTAVCSREYYYQSFPCVRVVCPGEFSIGVHADCMYGHHLGNLNFYLPVTSVGGSNSLVMESAPGKEDWHVLELDYGKICRFHGAACAHFTPENTTSYTRVSLDFRVLPGHVFEAQHDQYTSQDGYYEKCTKCISGEWLRESESLNENVDSRCGFPFTRTN